MTTKLKVQQKKSIEKPRDKNTLAIKADERKSKDRLYAEIGLSTNTLNAVTARNFTKGVIGEIDLTESLLVMDEKISKVNAGDLTELEATLTAQVTSLDTMFNAMAGRAYMNMGEHLHASESYMRLALKAQAQCARTIEVLAAMKNPPVVFAKQANISNGNQQVNNGSLPSSAPTHAGKTINQSNELLEVDHGKKTMDIGTTQTTSRKNKAMATLAT